MTQPVVPPPTPPQRGRPVADRGGRPSLMRNVLSNWGVLATVILYTLVITPIVVRALHQEAYGVWSFLNAFVAYASLFYLGLGSALLRFGAEYHASGDRNAFNRLVSVIITIYTGLAVVAILVAFVAAPLVPDLLSTATRSVSIAVAVLGARVGMMFIGAAFAGIIVTQGRTDLYSLVLICGHLSRLLIVPFAVRAPDPLLALALTVALTGAAEVTALARIAFWLDPGLRIRHVVPSRAELRTLYGFGISAFLLQLADRLISYTDTIVIGVMLGAGEVALYVLPLQLAEYGRMVIRGIVSVMLPHLSALLATGQSSRFRQTYVRTVRTTAMVAAFVSVSLVALGPMFLRVWVGPTLAAQALPVLICLGVAGFAQAIAVEAQTPFFLALRVAGPAAIVLLAEAVVNFGLSTTLARPMGIVGVALATAIPAVLVSGLTLTTRGARAAGVSIGDALRHAIAPGVGFALMLAAVHAGLAWIFVEESYAAFAVKLFLSAVSGAAIGWHLISHTDRRAIKVSVARITHQGRRLAGRLWDQEADPTVQ